MGKEEEGRKEGRKEGRRIGNARRARSRAKKIASIALAGEPYQQIRS